MLRKHLASWRFCEIATRSKALGCSRFLVAIAEQSRGRVKRAQRNRLASRAVGFELVKPERG